MDVRRFCGAEPKLQTLKQKVNLSEIKNKPLARKRVEIFDLKTQLTMPKGGKDLPHLASRSKNIFRLVKIFKNYPYRSKAKLQHLAQVQVQV